MDYPYHFQITKYHFRYLILIGSSLVFGPVRFHLSLCRVRTTNSKTRTCPNLKHLNLVGQIVKRGQVSRNCH